MLARFTLSRPVLSIMVTLIVLVLGSVALTRLRTDMLPSIELPTLTVRASLDGADPLVMEQLVTRILEEIIATVPGVEEISSQSYDNNARIRVSFAWGVGIDAAAMDVQATIEDEINELPDDVTGVRVAKFDVDSFPVMLLGISSTLDPVELTQLIEDQVRHRFTQVEGVAQVDVWGGFSREVRVELDPDRLVALRLPLDDIVSALRDANLELPAGRLEQGRHTVTLTAPAEFVTLDDIRNTVISEQDGALVRLGQVARVEDTYQRLTRLIRVNQGRGLRVAIRKQPEANTVEVARRVLEEIERVNADFPQLQVVPVINQGNFIERSIENVSRSVLYGGALAVVVLLLFLRSLPSTLVIAMAIPISVIATFGLLYFGGFTLNLMSLGGLALGVGMMVDSSVVVLENVFRRYRDLPEDATIAAVNGASEVAPAVVAGTITTLVIFLPLLLVEGVSGLLFAEFAYVVAFALSCSLLVSLTLVPLFAGRFLRNHRVAAPPFWYLGLERIYLALLDWALRFRLLTLMLIGGLFAVSLQLFPLIGSEFLPPSDEGEVRITGEMDVGTRLELVDRQARLIEALVFPAVPEVVSSVVSVGSSGYSAGQAASASIRLSLLPASQRSRTSDEIAKDLRKRLEGKVPGMKIRVRAPKGQFLLNRVLGTDEDFAVEVTGFDLDRLDLLARESLRRLDQVEGLSDLKMSLEKGVPQKRIQLDRDKIADLGYTVRDVADAIRIAVAGSNAGDFRIEGNAYRILVQLANAEQRSLDEVLGLTLRSRTGEAVALRNLVTVVDGSGPTIIERKDGRRIITISAALAGRDPGSVAADAERLLAGIPRPNGYDIRVSGDHEEKRKSFDQMMLSLVLALVLVYMVMAAQYESLRDPLVVMLSVPPAAIGVLVMLFLSDTTLNLQSGIGCIMLAGIVVNNAILLVDQSSRLRREGMEPLQAALVAGRRRLRPILMTTLTTILALLPLALGLGEGADAQAPLARAVIGGLLGSTLVTLILIPVVYTLFHWRSFGGTVGREREGGLGQTDGGVA